MRVAQQFGHPSGLLGAIVRRGMAKGNAELSRWVVQQAAAHHDDVVTRVAELGPGPGIGLQALLEGDVSALSAFEPADIVMANHVVYFWKDPAAEMARIRSRLGHGGLLALGYQLKQDMPAMVQRRVPPAGHQLYEADDQVIRLATAAGFGSVTHIVKGSAEAPEGRVMLATG